MSCRRFLGLVVLVALLVVPTTSVLAAPGNNGIDDPGDGKGIPLYVIIEVTWDGDANKDGSWTVHGPLWDPVVGGPVLASCPMGPVGTCLNMNYDFEFRGPTVQFDEVSVPTVDATPQAKHVVLYDRDGDGTYTGSLSAMHYFPWRAEPDGSWATLYFDHIDYEITFDSQGNVIDFRYLQYEHKKL